MARTIDPSAVHVHPCADPVRGTLVAVNADAASRLSALVARGEADQSAIAAIRAEGDALAIEVGGDIALRWRIAVVRAVMAAPPDGDAVRELYGELVDRYRDDPARLATLKPIGDEIRRLEAEGELASVLVARSDRRKKP
jgi:hypothetical protein